MLLDGESGGPYHDWQRVTPVLKKMLDETGLFDDDGRDGAAAHGRLLATFAPDFANYQAVVMNYDAPDERWPAALKASFEQYVTNGGGLVSVHAADNAFPGSPSCACCISLRTSGSTRRMSWRDDFGNAAQASWMPDLCSRSTASNTHACRTSFCDLIDMFVRSLETNSNHRPFSVIFGKLLKRTRWADPLGNGRCGKATVDHRKFAPVLAPLFRPAALAGPKFPACARRSWPAPAAHRERQQHGVGQC